MEFLPSVVTSIIVLLATMIVKKWFSELATKHDIEAIVNDKVKPVDNRINRHVDAFTKKLRHHEDEINSIKVHTGMVEPE